jgi:flavin reductase (DIM6/NTAB) family NADH-FMN oxidoreductase RutF
VKKILEPTMVLYPVPVVLVSAGVEQVNVMACHRISSCSTEPPRLAISVRPGRFTHRLIEEGGEFVVSIPAPEQALLADYLGVVSGREEDKLETADLRLSPALYIRTPLLADFPVNIECTVEQTVDLDSHTLFIGLVRAVHVEEDLLDERGDIDVAKAQGVAYPKGIVREKPGYKIRVEDLREALREGKA